MIRQVYCQLIKGLIAKEAAFSASVDSRPGSRAFFIGF